MNDPIPGPGSDGIQIDDGAVEEALAKSPAMAQADTKPPQKSPADYVVELARSPHGQTFLHGFIALIMQMEHGDGEVLMAAKRGRVRFTFRGLGPQGARLNFVGEGANFITAEMALRAKVNEFINRNKPNAPPTNDTTPKDGVQTPDGSEGSPEAVAGSPPAEPVQDPPAV